jgi:DNA-binding IclR family transcriptional regulator
MSSSAQRALRVLEIVSRSEKPLGVSEIARRSGISPGTAFRTLDALERCGYVARFQASTFYVPGETTTRLRQSLFAQFHLRDFCLPYMRRLAYATSETTTLTVPVGWYGVRISLVEGNNPVRSAPTIGTAWPMSEDFTGRAILAFQQQERYALFRAWAKRLGLGIAASELDAKLTEIRDTGYSIEPTEYAPGKAAIALPIRWQGEAIAAIAIEGPIVSLEDAARTDEVASWLETVRMIEQRVAERPSLFRNPFDHIDPDTIVLPVT